MRPNLTVLRSGIGPMLTETGTIERATGGWVYDPDLGMDIEERETVYAGRMLIAPATESTSTQEVGGRTDTLAQYDVTLPAETTVALGDIVTLTTSPTDPSLAGVEFKLTRVDLDPWAVARFCRAEQRN